MERINKILKDNNFTLFHCYEVDDYLIIELIDNKKPKINKEQTEQFFRITRVLNDLDIKYKISGYKKIKI